jgi:ZIP family zinc transporter
MMPTWLVAGLWGWLAGGALLLGALVGVFARVPARAIAGVMAFGGGVLVSALSFELVDEAYARGGFGAVAAGFLGGAAVYTAANAWLARRGARHRKRSGEEQASEEERPGSGTALAIGALIDGLPESAVIGASMAVGGRVSLVTVAAVFLSNLPEGLSSSAGMRRAGRSQRYILGLWAAICFVSGLASVAGYVALGGASPAAVAVITAVAAGGILAMLIDTMFPEAVARAHAASGLLAVVGFLAAFWLSKLEHRGGPDPRSGAGRAGATRVAAAPCGGAAGGRAPCGR